LTRKEERRRLEAQGCRCGDDDDDAAAEERQGGTRRADEEFLGARRARWMWMVSTNKLDTV
jgi:hypothetical protein